MLRWARWVQGSAPRALLGSQQRLGRVQRSFPPSTQQRRGLRTPAPLRSSLKGMTGITPVFTSRLGGGGA